jgi:hypothetical protein
MSRTNYQRNGTTLTEMVVAATLMVSAMAIVAPLTVRTGRLWQDSRRHQLVMDELSNELERLVSLTPKQRERAIAGLTPPNYLQTSLPAATLTAETIRDGDGTRLLLSMNWDRPGKPKPLTLVGWLDSMPSQNATQTDGASGNSESSEASP